MAVSVTSGPVSVIIQNWKKRKKEGGGGATESTYEKDQDDRFADWMIN